MLFCETWFDSDSKSLVDAQRFCDDSQSLFATLGSLAQTQEESTWQKYRIDEHFDPPFQNGCTTDLFDGRVTVAFDRFTTGWPTVSGKVQHRLTRPFRNGFAAVSRTPGSAWRRDATRVTTWFFARQRHGCPTVSLTDSRSANESVATVAEFLDTVSPRWQPATVTSLLPMPYPTIPGFIPRATAQKKYSRSKSSFIRDVDLAFDREDQDFLSHFRVGLNDGSEVPGDQATKDKLLSLQSKQPRWYVEVDFLETRYWQSEDEAASTEEGSYDSGAKPLSEVSTIELRHQLALAEQQIATQDQTIGRLEQDKTFLQQELENRRGEIDKLRGFFESVGDAADSTAKLRSGSEGSSVIDSGSYAGFDPAAKKGSLAERHLPTFHRMFTALRNR